MSSSAQSTVHSRPAVHGPARTAVCRRLADNHRSFIGNQRGRRQMPRRSVDGRPPQETACCFGTEPLRCSRRILLEHAVGPHGSADGRFKMTSAVGQQRSNMKTTKNQNPIITKYLRNSSRNQETPPRAGSFISTSSRGNHFFFAFEADFVTGPFAGSDPADLGLGVLEEADFFAEASSPRSISLALTRSSRRVLSGFG